MAERPVVTSLTARVLTTFRERLLAGFSWNVLSAVALQGSVLVSTIIVARILGLQSFGIYSVLVAMVMTIATVAQSGTGLVATKYVAEFLATDTARVGRLLTMCRVLTLATGTLAAVLVIAAADFIGDDVLGRPGLVPQVRLIALATLFQVSVAYQFGALQGFGAFRELSRAGVLAGIGHIAFTALGAWIGDISGATIGFVVASGFRMAVFAWALRGVRRSHGVPERAPAASEDFRLVWRFGLPAGLAGFVTMPCLWFVTVLVTRLPDGLALVAIFSVAHQVRLAVLQLPTLLNAVSFSVLSRLKGSNDVDAFRRVFWSNLTISASFVVATVTVLIALAGPLLRVYGSDFSDGRLLLVILLASVVPESLAVSCYQLMQASGRMWYSMFIVVIPRDLLYVVLASVLLGQSGVVGAGVAYLVAWIFALALILFSVRKGFPG